MGTQGQPLVYGTGAWEINLARRELRLQGETVPIGGRAFDLLSVLVRAAGQLVTKDDLMTAVWPGAIVGESTLHVHVSAIRKALGADRGMLQTDSGRGYRLLGRWTILHEATVAPPISDTPAPAISASRRISVPAAASALIGRAAAVQHLRDVLTAYRAVTLTGPGGIGKTALALEVSRRLFPSFGGDILLAELASLSEPRLVPSTVAAGLSLQLGSDMTSAETVARAVGSAKLLLVLDNCEQVIDAVAEFAEAIMRLCPSASVLATSREVLRIEGEYVYRVPPLDVPPEDEENQGTLLDHSAVQMFVARTNASRRDFSPENANLPAIAAICRRLDGIPLAIEFAAARSATLGVRQVAEGLDDRFNLLTSGRRTALPRHQTLRAVLDWSYELLPQSEQRLLRRLAIFASGFTLEAAEAIAAGGTYPRSEVLEGVANLVSKSLVTFGGSPTSRRWRLLETTRAYALTKLAESGELDAVARRHAEYFRDLFGPAEAESESQSQADWLAIYGHHIDDVRASLDWAFSPSGDAQIGVASTIAAVPLWVQLSRLGECRERVEQALASLDEKDPMVWRPRMQLSAALGWSLMYGVGRTQEAGRAWATVLELADRLDDRDYRLRALWGLCIDQFNNGEFRTALRYAQRFAGLVTDSSDTVELILGDRILGTALHYIGDQGSARRHIDRVIARLGQLRQQTQIVRLRFDMRVSTRYFQARILWLQGFADQALRAVENNVEEGRAIGHALTFCSVLGQAACPIAFLAGDLDAAAHYGAMLLQHTERHPIRLWHLWARCFNGLIAARRGDARGLVVLRRELQEAGDARYLPRFLLLDGELAACLGEAGRVGEGLRIVEEALTRSQTRDERWYMPELLRIRGKLLLSQDAEGAAGTAKDCFHQAIELARLQSALSWELRAALSMADLLQAEKREAEGRDLLATIYARFSEGFDTADLQAARRLLNGDRI